MEDQLISFETAKLSKEKGFNIHTQNYYNEYGLLNGAGPIEQGGNRRYAERVEWNQPGINYISAPTQSLLHKWLREIYNIHIIISPNLNKHCETYYFVSVHYMSPNKLYFREIEFKELHFTHEEAFERGLAAALNLLPSIQTGT